MAGITKRHRIVLITAGSIVTCLLYFSVIAESAERIIYSKDSLYHRILVYEDGFIRTLRFGVGLMAIKQSRIDIRDLHRHMLEYTRLTFAGLLLNQKPSKVLFIGLGGGVIPREIHSYFPNAEIDVVEIDPGVVKVAKNFFFFEPDEKLRVHVSDGRVFVRRCASRKSRPSYDLIILDAFNNEYIPFHLTTQEFLKQIATILHPKGVVLMNVFCNNQLFDAEFQTFLSVYGRCYVFFGNQTVNTMLVSPGPGISDLDPIVALARASLLQKRHDFSFDLVTVARGFKPQARPKSNARVLTDDRAPVNVLRHRPR